MITIRKSTSILLAAIALGGAALAVAGEASARPGRHGHGHGIHHRHHGHHHIWRGHYGPRFVSYYGGGYRCRFVRRLNAYGEVVVRRVCFNPYY